MTLTPNTALLFSACHDDEHMISHFMDYYKKLGIEHFGCIVSYYSHGLSKEEETQELQKLDTFYKKFSTTYAFVETEYLPQQTTDSRTSLWCSLLKKMNPDIEFIIPADSDELHEFVPDSKYIKAQFSSSTCNSVILNLEEVIQVLQKDNLDYITSCSMERVPRDGTVQPTISDVNIFDQFPCQNNKLFLQPKISLIKKSLVSLLPPGAHQISKENIEKFNLKSERLSNTHHFRWSKEGKLRIKKWVERYSSADWKGWKGAEKSLKRLDAFDHNLLTHIP